MSNVYSTVRIARDLGVSQSAVSYVLNGQWQKKRISAKTRDRILRYARRVHYRPNRLALGLRARHSNAIGVVVSNITGFFYQEILSGIEAVVGTRYVLLLGASENQPAKEAALIQQFLEFRVAGLLLAWSGDRGNDALLRECLAKQIPLVMLDRYHPRIAAHYVGANNRRLAGLVTRHLIDTGTTDVRFLSSPSVLTSVQERIQGYRETLREFGLPSRLVRPRLTSPDGKRPLGDDEEVGYAALRQVAARTRKPFGVVAANVPTAFGALRAARDLGLRIPEDLAVVTIGQEANSELLATPLTVATLPTVEIGREAARLLLKEIETPHRRNRTVHRLIEGEFRLGKSTVRPPAK